MSLNKYMHPRNIYKTPPNFKQLAIDYPEFRRHVKQDISGKVSLDFKDPEALRALTCTLLKKDFGLDIEIPLSKMIPTVPLRLNYILWIEDLLSIYDARNVRGIDIGTGTSCIYPLLAAKSKNWCMLATDIDEESIKCANSNVEKNCLRNLITVKQVQDGTFLKSVLNECTEDFDFCMCNPPFFASTNELNPVFKARRPDRPRPRNAFSAAVGEVVVDGGEVNFVTKLIAESKELDKKIRIYSSMVGHKSSLPPLKQLLRRADVMSFKQTEFYQGHTARWALAWTFHDIDLRSVPEATLTAARKAKPKPPLHFVLPTELAKLELGEINRRLLDMFENLHLDVSVVKESKNVVGYCISAKINTWSHQRRKRRAQDRLNQALSDDCSKSDAIGKSEVDDALEAVARLKVESPPSKSPPKRELEEEGFYNDAKRFKLDAGDQDECYLKSSIVIRKDNSDVVLELLFLSGSGGKEATHQMLQYIKNNLKMD